MYEIGNIEDAKRQTAKQEREQAAVRAFRFQAEKGFIVKQDIRLLLHMLDMEDVDIMIEG